MNENSFRKRMKMGKEMNKWKKMLKQKNFENEEKRL